MQNETRHYSICLQYNCMDVAYSTCLLSQQVLVHQTLVQLATLKKQNQTKKKEQKKSNPIQYGKDRLKEKPLETKIGVLNGKTNTRTHL